LTLGDFDTVIFAVPILASKMSRTVQLLGDHSVIVAVPSGMPGTVPLTVAEVHFKWCAGFGPNELAGSIRVPDPLKGLLGLSITTEAPAEEGELAAKTSPIANVKRHAPETRIRRLIT
jgi:hypothetical protein